MRVAAIVIVLIASAVFAGSIFDEGSDPNAPAQSVVPHSKAGLAAVQQFNEAKAKADAEYEKAILAALKSEVADLEGARVAAMKADDLDEAERCKAAKDAALILISSSTPSALSEQIIKQRYFIYHWVDGIEHPMEFSKDGKITVGAGGFEKEWSVGLFNGKPCVIISGSEGVFAHLVADKDGVFRGAAEKGFMHGYVWIRPASAQ